MTEHYDIVVIGGGIHGVGVAQAAACAGYSVKLLEQSALASGSSSRSSKLIHGGLRYLESFDLHLVRESLAERTTLLRIAPDLVQLQPFYIPVYPQTSRRPLTLRAGLSLYALLGGLGHASRFRTLPQRDWDSLDGLRTDTLEIVFQYYDAQTDDAGLTRAVMQSAIGLGAELECLAEFTSAKINATGSEIQYRTDSDTNSICTAGVLINAAGPWAENIDKRLEPQPAQVPVDLIQGTHLIMPEPVTAGCYYMEAPQDKRAIFLLPWGEHSLLGTTEHLYHGDPSEVSTLDIEQTYLIDVLNHYFPDRYTTVIDRFSGLRVLPTAKGGAFHRSRETQLVMDNPQQPRVLSIYGGKLTGYRATAEKVISQVRRSLPSRKARGNTSELKLTPVD